MLLAEIGAEGWVLIIGAVGIALTNIITSTVQIVINAYQEKNKILREEAIAKKVDIAAEKVAEVSSKQDTADRKQDQVAELVATKQQQADETMYKVHENLANKVDNVEKIAIKTQAYVNGATTVHLQKILKGLNKIASLTRLPEDIHAAELAKQELDRHLENQPKS